MRQPPLTLLAKITWILPRTLVRPLAFGLIWTRRTRLAPLPETLILSAVLTAGSFLGSTLVTVTVLDDWLPIGSSATIVILCWPSESFLAPCQPMVPDMVVGGVAPADVKLRMRLDADWPSTNSEIRGTPEESVAEA